MSTKLDRAHESAHCWKQRCKKIQGERDLLLAIKDAAQEYMDDTGAEHNWYDYPDTYKAIMDALDAYDEAME